MLPGRSSFCTLWAWASRFSYAAVMIILAQVVSFPPHQFELLGGPWADQNGDGQPAGTIISPSCSAQLRDPSGTGSMWRPGQQQGQRQCVAPGPARQQTRGLVPGLSPGQRRRATQKTRTASRSTDHPLEADDRAAAAVPPISSSHLVAGRHWSPRQRLAPLMGLLGTTMTVGRS